VKEFHRTINKKIVYKVKQKKPLAEHVASFSHPPKIQVYTVAEPVRSAARRIVSRMHPAWMATSLIMILSFMAGMVTVWQTQLSAADSDQVPLIASGGLVTTLQQNDADLNVVADLLPILIQENRHEPTPEEIKSKERRDKLKAYLASKKSPLATDEAAIDAFLVSNNMEMMLAISFVEGNFCKHHVAHNCSGIGGAKMRKYSSFADWIRDFDSLLERKYKGLKVEQYIGYYVVPGSEGWKRGVYQVLGELKQKGIQ
jgi:hypothetical protein